MRPDSTITSEPIWIWDRSAFASARATGTLARTSHARACSTEAAATARRGPAALTPPPCGVREDRHTRELQAHRVPVDQGQNAPGAERIAHEQARQRGAGERAAAQRERRIERGYGAGIRAAPAAQLSMCTDSVSRGMVSARAIPVVHAHEGRDVQILVELRGEDRRVRPAALQDVRASLSPRCVRDLGEHRLQALAGGIQAVVEADGVEAASERAQLREHPDRSRGP